MGASMAVTQGLDFSGYNSVVDVFDEACERFRELPAFSNLGRTYSYQELSQDVNRFATFLQQESGLNPGDRIAIQLPNIIQYPVVFFGALKAGLVVVNTNPLYTAEEMQHQFEDSGVKAIVILANMAHKLEQIIDQTCIQSVIVTELADCHSFARRHLINKVLKHVKRMVPAFRLPGAVSFVYAIRQGRKKPFVPVPLEHNALAILQYTGGTTGVAKGAMLSHKNLLANMLQVKDLLSQHTIEGREVAIAPLPFYHIYSLTVNCLLMMHIGCHVVLITNPRDIAGFVSELRKWRFTIFSGLNTLFAALAKHSRFQQISFSDLKLTISGGMSLNPDVAKQWQKLTGCEVVEGYGLTETSPIVAVNPPDKVRLGTIGVPIVATEVCLMDEQGNRVAEQPGELCVRGPQVMQGYWQREDETRMVLDDDGWLRTGDIAEFIDDGYIRIVDRKKDLIIVSGFNVYPAELEQVVCQHPDIDESVAVGIPDPQCGERIKLFVVSNNPDLSRQDIRHYMRKHLTSYKVPKSIEFCSELPKSPVGKVLRRVVRDRAIRETAGSKNEVQSCL